MTSDFNSVLASDIRNFLDHKRALKKRFLTEEYALRLLDRFLSEQGINSRDGITASVLDSFIKSRRRTRPRSFNHLVGVVRRFFSWMAIQEIIAVVPTLPPLRQKTGELPPCIFSKEQAKQLLDAAARLPDSRRAKNRGATYHMAFALAYGLGLRASELSRLRLKDVDLEKQVLIVRESKFSKSRLVPFGPNITSALRKYIDCLGLQDIDGPVFSCDLDRHRRRPVTRNSLTRVFHQLITQLNIHAKPGENSPRLHGLRHSMAVGTLLRWYQQGKCPSDRLIHLSTFLGHANISSTAVYLTVTSDLLTEAGNRFEKFAQPIIESTANDDT